jgi:hypothetical protein
MMEHMRSVLFALSAVAAVAGVSLLVVLGITGAQEATWVITPATALISISIAAITLSHRFPNASEPEKLYSERLSEQMSHLAEASRRVDSLLDELREVATNRETAVRKLEIDLISLQDREKELRRTIDELKDVPLPVADRLAALIEPGEKRSEFRDYFLFGAGVIVSTIVSYILEIAL